MPNTYEGTYIIRTYVCYQSCTHNFKCTLATYYDYRRWSIRTNSLPCAYVLNFIRLFRTVRRFIINSVPADSFESNRPESKRVPFSSLPTALFCKHPPEVHAGDIRIGTHRRMKGEVTNSNKAHVAQSNTARVIIEVCLEVIYPPGGFKPLACCVRRK